MTQLIIEINDSKALKLIEDLEELKLIRVLKGRTKKKITLKNVFNKTNESIKRTIGTKKMSEQLAGSLTASQAKVLDRELKKIRSEWARGI